MKQLSILLTVCFSALWIPILADEYEEVIPKIIDDAELNVQLLDLSAAPSSIVGGTVNVITGSYFNNECDLKIHGANPFVLQRSYNSSSGKKGSLCHGWDLNYPSTITILNNPLRAHVDDRGTSAIFKYSCRYEDRDMEIGSKQLRYGVTNCFGGFISSQTNLKNRRLQHYAGSRYCELYIENGEKLFYSKFKDNLDVKKYCVTKNQLPTGCSFDYSYDYKDRLFRVTSKGQKGNSISHIRWNYPEKFKDQPMLRLKSSDGRSITYKYKKQKSKDYDGHRYCLASVTRDDAPKVSYEYEEKNRLFEKLVKKSLPNNRYLKIKYYKKGINKFGSKEIEIFTIKDSRMDRVSRLYAPVGTDATPILIWDFKYNLNKKHRRDKPIGGSTVVIDALGHKKQYYFNDEQRLTSVDHYLDNKTLYRKEKMIWGNSDSKKENTFLLARGVVDKDNMLLARKDYQYDRDGNVLTDTLRGNLTGTCTPLEWKSYKKAETYSKTYTYNKKGLLRSESDGRKRTFYEYCPKSNLVRLKLVLDNEKIRERTHFTYDANSVLIQEITDDGSSAEINDHTDVTERRIKKITPTTTQPIGLPESVEEYCLCPLTGQEQLISRQENLYSKTGNLLCQNIYDSSGAYCYSKKWSYDAYNNVIEEIDPLGMVTTYQYDQNCNRIFQQTPNLQFYTVFIYDYSNRLICQKDIYTNGLELVTRHSYDYMGNRIASTDIYGNTTKYRYDEFGRLIEKINPPIIVNGEMVSPIDKVGYDCLNNPTERIDANGCTITTSYTALGKPYLITYPDGSSESFVYALDGVLVKSTGKNGSYTIYEYDYQQRCTSKKVYSSLGEFLSETSAIYNAFHVLSEVDAAGSATHYTYDGAGRKTHVRKNDAETIYVYDSLGREKECQERFGDGPDDYIIKVKQYDFLNRIIEETVEDPCHNIYQKATFGYDAMGNRNRIETYNDAGVNLQIIEYDSMKRPIKVTDALGNITTTHFDYFFYNSNGQIVAYQENVDPLGNREITILDTMGNIAVKMRKNSFGDIIQKTEFNYDKCCRKIRSIETAFTQGVENRQIITEYGYDVCGRLTSLTEAKGTSEVKHTRYTYTIAGEKKEIIKPDGNLLRHEYDALGRLCSLSSSDGSIDYNYTYDQLNNPICIIDEVHHTTTTKEYNSNNRLIVETLGNNLKIRYSYDRLGRATVIELPDGSFQQTCYSSINISEMRRLAPDGTISYSHLYTSHDLSGKILTAQLAGGAGTLQINYDLLGRPSSISAPNWAETLKYDAVGNVTKRNLIDAEGPLECSYTHDDLYQLNSETGATKHEYQHDSLYNRTSKDDKPLELNALNQLLSDSETTYIYDLNGNLIQQKGLQTFTCTYDALDRLISVQTLDETIEYLYDSENRRLTKLGGPSGTSHYFYIGSSEIGSCNAEGKVLEYRLLGQGKGAEIGAAVALEIEDNLYIPLHDAQGSLVTLLNRNGEALGIHRYSAFGEETTYGIAEINPWRFSSKRFDRETGFIYFGRRYYAPTSGRWVTPDPIGYEGGPNLYCYVLNAPLTHFDLYGLYKNDEMLVGFPGPSLRDLALTRMLINSIVPSGNPEPNSSVSDSSLFLSSREMFPQPPETFSVGTKELPNLGFGFTNGICTSRERAYEIGKAFSDLSGGYKCDVVHNPSGGLSNDIKRYAISSRSLIATNVVEALHKNWNHFFDNSSKYALYLQSAHSEGVNNVKLALMSYNKERAQRIQAVLIAPSVYIDRGICRKVDHYVSTHDFVPLVDSAGRARNIETTHVLERHKDADWWDHDCLSPTYQPVLEDYLKVHFNNGSKIGIK